MWSEYLQGTYHHPSLGWCISAASLGAPQKVLSPHSVLTHTPQRARTHVAHPLHLLRLSHVSSRSTAGLAGCADPVPVLTAPAPGPRARCTTDAACGDNARCVLPREDAELLRISVLSDEGPERVILWRGPREEVWEEGMLVFDSLPNTQYSLARIVRVGIWAPRISFLPLWLPPLVGVLYE